MLEELRDVPVLTIPPNELHMLLGSVHLERCCTVLDPWASMHTVRDVFHEVVPSVQVISNDPTGQVSGADYAFSPLAADLYDELSLAVSALVCCPPTQFASEFLSLASRLPLEVSCVRVPASWVDNSCYEDQVFLHSLFIQNRVVQLRAVSSVNKWMSRYCWLCIFKDQDTMHSMLRLSAPTITFQPIYIMA
jgi:hypothetical protein